VPRAGLKTRGQGQPAWRSRLCALPALTKTAEALIASVLPRGHEHAAVKRALFELFKGAVRQESW